MTTTTRGARLRGIAAAAAVILGATLLAAVPAQATPDGVETNAVWGTDVIVSCESLGDSYLCDASVTGFATVDEIRWNINGVRRREFNGQWTIFVPCRMGDHDFVLADVHGTDSAGYSGWDSGWDNSECTCHEGH